jgi:wyosine [tRNA(Phe)-imidazoG37] synthetase (radical SAM superfamily)
MYKYLFGPVPSRRLGVSLGIDLVPKKVCSLNCVYCEVGKTTNLTTKRAEYIKYDEIIKELTDFMKDTPKLDYITFSGSGEPTLNIYLGKIIKYIKDNYKNVKLALLTNGTLFDDSDLRKEIADIDVILPSLDAGSDKVFRRIDRAAKELNLETYINGLVNLRNEYSGKIWLEVFLLKGYNDSKEELLLIKNAILKINPDKIQLNTLDRPGAISNLKALTENELNEVIKFWNLSNIEVIANPPQRVNISSYNDDIENKILNMISRRPSTLNDLHNLLGVHINEINKYLGVLEENNKIETIEQNRGVFYQLVNK